MLADRQDAEIAEPVVARRRQRQLVTDPVGQLVRSGQDRQCEGEIGGATGHRPSHGEIDAPRHSWGLRRASAAQWNQIDARLMREDAAEMRRRTQRTADV